MTNPLAVIRSFGERLRLAWMVFSEAPDEVVTLTRTEGGSVEFRYRFGFGIAGSHRAALEGIAQQYGLFLGQRGMNNGEEGGEQ